MDQIISTIHRGPVTTALSGQMLNSRLEANREGRAISFVYADTPALRAACYELVFQNYLMKNYVQEKDGPYFVNDFNATPGSVTIAAMSGGEVVGTVSCFQDSLGRLPADMLFNEELSELRLQGKKIAEIGRLAVHTDFQNNQEVVTGLINRTYIYSSLFKKNDVAIIEVNPRHTFFYEKLLNFNRVGVEKSCSFVNDAPAILLCENYDLFRSFHGGEPFKKRCLYNKFISVEKVEQELSTLQRINTIFSEAEKSYYGFLGQKSMQEVEVDLEFAF